VNTLERWGNFGPGSKGSPSEPGADTWEGEGGGRLSISTTGTANRLVPRRCQGDPSMARPRKRVRPRDAAPRMVNIVNEIVELAPGKERHLRFRLRAGDALTVTCRAKTKFYAALLDRTAYAERVGGAGDDAFQFEFGTDKRGFTDRAEPTADDDYYLVLRVGVFSERGFISTVADLRRVGTVEPTIRSG
jgi:hypothetical protein